MKPTDIRVFDWHRFTLGEVKPEFLLEVVLRISFLYVVLVLAMRIMGRRVASGLTRNELVAVTALAGAIGPAVQAPERGLLPPVIIVALVVLFHRTLTRLTRKSGKAEQLLQGRVTLLISDGRLHLDAAKQSGISRELLLAQVRVRGATQLGEVERLYLEENGAFTLLRRRETRPGLSTIPSFDHDFLQEQERSSDSVCENCGTLAAPGRDSCPHCGRREFSAAVH